MERFFLIVVFVFIIMMFAGLFVFGIPEYIQNKHMSEDTVENTIDTIRIYEGLDTTYIDTIWAK